MSCRLCMKRGETMIPIFPNEHIKNNIKLCLDIDVTAEKELPNRVCIQCTHKLEEFSTFKNFSLTVDRILRNAKLSGSLLFADPVLTNEFEHEDDSTSSTDENEEVLETKDEFKGYKSESEEKAIKSRLEDYEKHQKPVLPADLKCYVCGKHFLSRENLLDHVKTHFSEQGRSERKNLDIPKEITRKKEKIKCPVCSIDLFRGSLNNHMNKHSDRYKCNICQLRCATRSTLDIHIKSLHTTIRDYICSECGKQFAHMGLLKVHMQSHGSARLYKCKLCNYAGKTGQALRRHNHTHIKERTHLCDMCPKTFRTGINLRLHRRRVHFDERKHCCEQCGLRFFTLTKYRNHLRIHTGEKPFTCEKCSKQFSRNDALKEHYKVHARVVGKCFNCKMLFRTLEASQSHLCKKKGVSNSRS